MSLKKANEHRNAWFEGVQKCHLDESLYTVMEKIVRAEVHRLVVTDENEKVIGIISLSDILLYLVLRPSGDGIGDSESLRASDPILRERTDSVSTALLYNNSNESIEEETNNELEAEKNGEGLKKKVAGDDDDADDNNNSVEEAEEAIPVPDDEEKTEDNLNDNANNNNEPSSPVKSDSNDEVIDIEDEEDDEDEAENELTITSNNNTLSNSLSIQREVAMVSE